MLKNRAPCICGHSKSNHLSKNFHLSKNIVDIVVGCSVLSCGCDQFKMDNLKFLEKENDARK